MQNPLSETISPGPAYAGPGDIVSDRSFGLATWPLQSGQSACAQAKS